MQTSFLSRLTLRQLDVFIAVCQQRSYSKAAQQLSLTQPAVSAQIRSLEDVIGQALFDYLGKQLYLTPAGDVLLRAARDFKQRLVHLEIELTELHGTLQGTLNVAIESSAETLLPALINQFLTLHSGADIALQVCNHQGVLARLDDNAADLAIMTRVPGDRDLSFTPFAEHRLLAVAASDHPLAMRGAPITLLELLDYPLLLREPGSGTRRVFEDYCQQRSCVVRDSRQWGSNQAIAYALADSDACAILPAPLVAALAPGQQLATLAVEGFPIRRSWCTAHPKGKHLNPLGAAFLNFLHSRG